MEREWKQGDKVHVSGDVEWGDTLYRVSTEGVIEEWSEGTQALVTLDYVDGDCGVCIYVNKEDISPLDETNE